jgi:hypothetical protein
VRGWWACQQPIRTEPLAVCFLHARQPDGVALECLFDDLDHTVNLIHADLVVVVVF